MRTRISSNRARKLMLIRVATTSTTSRKRDREALRYQPAGGVAAFKGDGGRWPHLARPRGAVAALSLEPRALKAVDDWLSRYRAQAMEL